MPLFLSALLLGLIGPSPAVSNVVDAAAAKAAAADYANNVLRIVALGPKESLPANMPFQLVVGTDPADRAAAEAAVTLVATSMPSEVRAFYEGHKLMAPLTQWMLRRCHPGVTDEETYLRPAAHPSVWRARDFDPAALAKASGQLTDRNIPTLAVLHPVYEEYEPSPIRRAVPWVDYPDPRPEATFETPFGVSLVLRAPEVRRKFRFRAAGSPFNDAKVSFLWLPMSDTRSGQTKVGAFQGKNKELPPARGFGEIVLDWRGVRGRQDVLVFARYDGGPWGPPSVISFFVVPNERRVYSQQGRIESIDYVKAEAVVLPLYQNKPWKDEFTYDSFGKAIGCSRTRAGMFRGEPFSMDGEAVVETYPNELPKVTSKVRYFTRPDDPATLDYEVLDEEISHPNREIVPRDRGEFPRREQLRSSSGRLRLDK